MASNTVTDHNTRLKHRKVSKSWMKNVARSFGYSIGDQLKSYNPVIVNLAKESKDVGETVFNKVKEFTAPSTEGATSPFSLAKNTATDIFKNAIDDIKTGNLYNKQRDEQMDKDFAKSMGIDFDFDFDFGDEDWGDNDSSDSMELAGDQAIMDNDNRNTAASINAMDVVGGKVAGAVSSATAQSAQYVAESNRQSSKAIFALNQKGFETTVDSIMAVNKSVSAFAQIGQPLTEHINNSATFYTKMTDMMSQTNTMLSQIVENTKPAPTQADMTSNSVKNTFSEIFGSDGINLTGLMDMIKDNVKEQSEMYTMIFDMMKGMFGDVKGSGSAGKNISIAKMGLNAMTNAMIPKMMKESMQTLNDSIKYAMGGGLLKLKNKAGNFDNPLLNIISEIFVPKSNYRETIKNSAYEKGKISFDGVTKKAITDVIPIALMKIYSAISGEDEMRYDYDQGRFITYKRIRKNVEEQRRQAAYRAGDEYRRDALERASQSSSDPKRQAELEKQINSYFENAFRKGGNFYDIRNDEEFYKNNKEYGLGKESQKILVDLLKEYKKSNDRDTRTRGMRFVTDVQEERDRFGSSMSAAEASGTSLYRYLNDEWGEEAKKNGIKSGRFFDQYGHNDLFYLRGIYVLLGGSDAGSISKGKSKGRNTSSEMTTRSANSNNNVTGSNGNKDADWYFQNMTDEETEKNKKKQKDFENYLNKIGGDLDQWKDETAEKFGLKGKLSSILDGPTSAVTGLINSISNSLESLIFGRDPDDPEGGLLGWITKNAKVGLDKIFEKAFDGKSFGDKFKEWTDKLFGVKDEKTGKREGGKFSELYNQTGDSLKAAANWVFNPVKESFEKGDGDSLFGEVKENWKQGKAISKSIQRQKRKQNKRNKNKDSGEGSGLYYYSGAGEGDKEDKKKKKKTKEGKIHKYLREGINSLTRDASIKFNQINFETEDADGVKRKRRKGGKYKKADNEEDQKKERALIQSITKKSFEDLDDSKGAIAAGALIGGGVSLLTGATLGPIFGSAIGAATGFIIKSKTVQNILFGEMDENGERQGGLISKNMSKFISEAVPGAGRGAAIGLAGGLFMGSPILGAVLGGALGFVQSSEQAQNFLFGEKDENGERTGGFISKNIQDVFKDKFPNMTAGAIAGLIAGPFGPVGNIVFGSALGYYTTSQSFQDWLFGKEDKNGKRSGGLVGKIREKVIGGINDLFHNLSKRLIGSVNRIGHNVGRKIQGWLTKIADKAKEGKGPFKIFKPFFTAGEWLGKKVIGGAVNVVGGAIGKLNDHTKKVNLKHGYGVYGKKVDNKGNVYKGELNAAERLKEAENLKMNGRLLREDYDDSTSGKFDKFLSEQTDTENMKELIKLTQTAKSFIGRKEDKEKAMDRIRELTGIENLDVKEISNFDKLIKTEMADKRFNPEEQQVTLLDKLTSVAEKIGINVEKIYKVQSGEMLSDDKVKEVKENIFKRHNSEDRKDYEEKYSHRKKNSNRSKKFLERNNENTRRSAMKLTGGINDPKLKKKAMSIIGRLGDKDLDEDSRNKLVQRLHEFTKNSEVGNEEELSPLKQRLAEYMAKKQGKPEGEVTNNSLKNILKDTGDNIASKIANAIKGVFKGNKDEPGIFNMFHHNNDEDSVQNTTAGSGSRLRLFSGAGDEDPSDKTTISKYNPITGLIEKFKKSRDGDLEVDTSDSSTKESKKMSDKFHEGIASIKGGFGNLASLFGKFKDKLFGEGKEGKKEESFFDKLKNWAIPALAGLFTSFFGEGSIVGGILTAIAAKLGISTVKEIVKNGVKNLIKKVIKGGAGTAVFAGTVLAASGKLDKTAKNLNVGFGNGSEDRGPSNEYIYTDENGNPVTKNEDGIYVDENGNPVQNVHATRGDVDSLSSRVWKAEGRSALKGKNGLMRSSYKKSVFPKITKAISKTKLGSIGSSIGSKITSSRGAKGLKTAFRVGKNAGTKEALNIAERGLTKSLSTNIEKMGAGIIKAVEKVAPKLAGRIAEAMPKFTKALSSRLGPLIAKGAKSAGKVVAQAGKLVPFLNAALIISDFITGYEDARATLKIFEEPTQGQRIVCGVLRLVKNLIPMVGPIIPDSLVVDIITKYLGPAIGLDFNELKKQQEDAQAKMDAYNKINGTDYTVSEGVKKLVKDYTFTERIGNAAISTIEDTKNKFNKFKSNVKEKGIGGAIKDVANSVTDTVKQAYNDNGGGIIGIVNGIGAGFKKILPGVFGELMQKKYEIFSHALKGDLSGLWSVSLSDFSGGGEESGIEGVKTAVPSIFSRIIGQVPLISTKLLGTIIGSVAWLGKKIYEFGKPVFDPIGKGLKNMWSIGKDAITTNPINLWQTEIPGDENNILDGVFKTLGVIQKVIYTPISAISWVTRKHLGVINDYIAKPVIDSIKNFAIINKDALFEKPSVMWKRDPVDNPDNPLNGVMKAFSIIQKIIATPLSLISFVGRKIFGGFDKFVIAPAKDGFKNFININKNLFTQDPIEMWKTKPVDNPNNPFNGIMKATTVIQKVSATPLALMVHGFRTVWKGIDKIIVQPVKKDIEPFGKNMKTIWSSIESGDISSIWTENESIGLNSIFSPVFMVLHGIAKVIGTLVCAVKMVADKVGKFISPIVDKVKEVIGGIREKVEGVSDWVGNKADSVSDWVGGALEKFGLGSGLKHKSGGSSGFISQNDPNYANRSYAGGTFGEKGCAPSVAAMTGKVDMDTAISNSKGYQNQYGTSMDYFTDTLGAKPVGVGGAMKSLERGESVVMLGRDPSNKSKDNSPFGPNGHYVLANGLDSNGNVVVSDPEANGPRSYSPKSLLNGLKYSASMGAGSGLIDYSGAGKVGGDPHANDNVTSGSVRGTTSNVNSATASSATITSETNKTAATSNGYQADLRVIDAMWKGEMGGRGPGTIENDIGDGMGKNYGMFSFTQKTRIKPLTAWLKKNYPNIGSVLKSEPGSSAFDKEWKSLNNSEEFKQAQVTYALSQMWLNNVVKPVKKLTGINLNDGSFSEGVASIALSYSNWRPAAFTSASWRNSVIPGLKKLGKKPSSKDVIEVIYGKMMDEANHYGPSSKFYKGWTDRWEREKKRANKLSTGYKYLSSGSVSTGDTGTSDSSEDSNSSSSSSSSGDILSRLVGAFTSALGSIFGENESSSDNGESNDDLDSASTSVDGDWMSAVKTTKENMAKKNPIYYGKPGAKSVEKLPVGKNNKNIGVRPDCSGLVSGMLMDFTDGSFGGLNASSKNFANPKWGAMKKAGFKSYKWKGWEKLQEGDILASNPAYNGRRNTGNTHHVEVYGGKGFNVYSGGSTDALRASSTTTSGHKDGYQTVWRYVGKGNTDKKKDKDKSASGSGLTLGPTFEDFAIMDPEYYGGGSKKKSTKKNKTKLNAELVAQNPLLFMQQLVKTAKKSNSKDYTQYLKSIAAALLKISSKMDTTNKNAAYIKEILEFMKKKQASDQEEKANQLAIQEREKESQSEIDPEFEDLLNNLLELARS